MTPDTDSFCSSPIAQQLSAFFSEADSKPASSLSDEAKRNKLHHPNHGSRIGEDRRTGRGATLLEGPAPQQVPSLPDGPPGPRRSPAAPDAPGTTKTVISCSPRTGPGSAMTYPPDGDSILIRENRLPTEFPRSSRSNLLRENHPQ